jgi:HEAT repeat protein
MGRSTDGLQTIPTSVTEPILAIARDESDNQSVRQQALSVLGRLDHGAGIPPLIDLSKQLGSNWLARESMSTLARSGDPRARQYLRTAVRRTGFALRTC